MLKTLLDTLKGVKVDANKAYLPKVGWVKFYKSRDIEGTIKNTTISRKSNGWYVSFQTEKVETEPKHQSTTTVGIDRGVKHFAVCSDNIEINYDANLDKYYNRLTIEQRKLSRKKKFSNNWYKQRKKVSLLHNKITNIRNDFLHKESTKLIKKPRSNCT